MADKAKTVDEFVKFTCCTEAEAKRYLEATDHNLEAALTAYFDDRDDRVNLSNPGGSSAQNIVISSDEDSMHVEDNNAADSDSPESAKRDRSPDKSGAKGYKRTTNVATLSSLRTARDTEDEDDDQLYYAGGSEHSGQQIMGNDRRGDVAGEVFKHLKKMVSVGDVEVAGPSRESRKPFSGVGYRLGATPDDTQVVNKARTSSSSDRAELHLKLWRDGFSLGDEPLRPYSDPDNREAIESILRGEVPLDLVPVGTKGGKVNVKVEDLRHSNYAGSGAKGRFFTGPGHVLGNVVPTIVKEDPVEKEKTEAAGSGVAEAAASPPPQSPLTVDDSAPLTNIAVRLPNGSRTQVRLNLTHSVEDLRTHLTALNKELQGETFVFIVGFPPKEVADEKQSLSDAGFVNSSVHLRIKKN